ncbi:hypothetical protein QW060_22245 [Myroides ceti]|uniref:Uncharacterized protein n=1 Tax=Paenimyroides ceti TaxID=395087 RepID=A0ABT8CZD5_9FLAO|nr:hypothetical protein [Paenimyroides ceti]MDN3706686.1 hypothetical protein [Paenimyroides ceti]MDN3709682.1 hypothetical protein [Paenimyroides ceti]
MIKSKNDPDYIFEEYKGYTIASHKNNVVGKDIDNLIIVYKSEEFPNHGYIVGLDDSKMSGYRKSLPNNIEDAKAYIDWAVKIREEMEMAIKPENAYDLRVNKGVLPTIDIAGHTFYVDIRMDMLRPKDDFLSKGIVFDEIDHYFSEERNAYLIPYDPKKHEFRELDYNNLVSVPKDLIAVEFPFQKELDLIGWNRKGGWDIKEDLKPTGIKLHFEAKIVSWKETYINDIIKDNLNRLKDKSEKEKLQSKPSVPSQNQQSKKGRKM